MAEQLFDTIVIGTRQRGRFLLVDLAAAGQKVRLVERAQLGGVCVNTGCTPTKMMVAGARLAYQARRGAEYSVRLGPVSVDLGAVRERKRAMDAIFTHPLLAEDLNTLFAMFDASTSTNTTPTSEV